ncbi:MAG: hypothetical protein LH618_03675, partial [Saprospiraceae bacterium]|nr:hypothetical protein [Saprospiraceae bacterium]
PEQRTKFEQTDRTYKEKMKSKRAASKEEMGKMREERMKAHKSFLTKEQAEKYDRMEAKKQAKQEGRKEGKKGGKGKMPKKDRTGDPKAPDNSRTREN